MIKKFQTLLIVFLLGCTTTLFSQQSVTSNDHPRVKEEGKTVFKPHWFLSVQGGAAYTLGEAGFGDLVSPSAAVAVGYKFTPLLGLRGEASGWQAKGGWVNPNTTYKYKYLQGSLDAMLDLSSLCCGFNPKRTFNTYLFVGVGLTGAFDNDEAVALDAQGYKITIYGQVKSLFCRTWRFRANLRLSDHIAINLEVNANTLSDKFNSKKDVMQTGSSMHWQVLLLLFG